MTQPQAHSTGQPTPGESWFSARTVISVLVTAALGLLVAISRSSREPDVHQPAVLSAEAPRVSQERCAECHSDITGDFHLAPHSRTLHRATDADVIGKFAGRSFHRDDSDVAYEFEVRDGQLQVSSPAYARDLPITWIFGSGTHAQTPLVTWTDRDGKLVGIEHSVSWYPPDELGATLDMATLEDTSGMSAHGRYRDAAKVANCFGCHSTFVPTDEGRVDLKHIQPNVGCARCHWDVAEHVRQMDAGLPATIERFSDMTALESVERCGECHRRASEMGGTFTPDDPTIVRFASVGLTQSPCFVHQSEVTLASGETARLDCTTCHNPHRPAIREWQHHTQVCLTCHDVPHDRSVHADEALERADEERTAAAFDGGKLAAGCPVATRADNCLTCHMPKLPSNEHLEFTDHWIRVRKSSDAAASVPPKD